MTRYALITELRAIPDDWSPQGGIVERKPYQECWIAADVIAEDLDDVQATMRLSATAIARKVERDGWPAQPSVLEAG